MTQDHKAALESLRQGVEMDKHNLDDGEAKLSALDAAIALFAANPPTPTAALPVCHVIVKDGRIIGTDDEPGQLYGIYSIPYVPAHPNPTGWRDIAPEDAEPMAWLVEWEPGDGNTWVEAFANELSAIERATQYRGRITPLYPAPPSAHPAEQQKCQTCNGTGWTGGYAGGLHDVEGSGTDAERCQDCPAEQQEGDAAGEKDAAPKLYHFEQRSKFGPWIEVGLPTEKSVPFVQYAAMQAMKGDGNATPL